jgi:hypothetical protein
MARLDSEEVVLPDPVWARDRDRQPHADPQTPVAEVVNQVDHGPRRVACVALGFARLYGMDAADATRERAALPRHLIEIDAPVGAPFTTKARIIVYDGVKKKVHSIVAFTVPRIRGGRGRTMTVCGFEVEPEKLLLPP